MKIHFYSFNHSCPSSLFSLLPAGLSVRGVRQRPQCPQPGLPDRQPPDPDRTQNCGDGGDGGDGPLRSERDTDVCKSMDGVLPAVVFFKGLEELRQEKTFVGIFSAKLN